ncbi:MAG: ferrous iron transporter B [Ruminococcus sp.]
MSADKRVILIGNPNVGKSSIFNKMTGENQHTGNWTGKTVDSVESSLVDDRSVTVVDLPGIYTLAAASAEEIYSKNYLTNHKESFVIIVVDGNCICKSLTLIEETRSLASNIIICVNQYKSATKSGVKINLEKMQEILGLPVITAEATDKDGCEKIKSAIQFNINNNITCPTIAYKSIDRSSFRCQVVSECDNTLQKRLDKIFTSKITGIPIMIILLTVVLYITIIGANYPSELLSALFSKGGEWISNMLSTLGCPNTIISFICDGVYRTVTWVVSVMLPPMAIFFPIFALLENFGYLPRVAFNLDNVFRKANCSGKQALTMCMGFGCNACGVTECRIIPNKKQRLNAIVTNNFVPCNGRFPTLIAVITIFMASSFGSYTRSIISALILTAFIILSILVSMGISLILSKTILKNDEKELVMEMPRFKKPKIVRTIYDSIKNRAVFVLLRALVVALPAGAIIWICANATISNESILSYIVKFFEPVGEFFGLDGEIIIGLLLGFPANEIVIPIVLMAYSGSSTLVDYNSINELGALLINNGWTIKTAICMIIIVLMHFPCSTTCLTIYKETKSVMWTLISMALPTMAGLLLCFLVNIIL